VNRKFSKESFFAFHAGDEIDSTNGKLQWFCENSEKIFPCGRLPDNSSPANIAVTEGTDVDRVTEGTGAGGELGA
jgi:hypothetical protein